MAARRAKWTQMDRYEVHYGPTGFQKVYVFSPDCHIITTPDGVQDVKEITDKKGTYWVVGVTDDWGMLNATVVFDDYAAGAPPPAGRIVYGDAPVPADPAIVKQLQKLRKMSLMDDLSRELQVDWGPLGAPQPSLPLWWMGSPQGTGLFGSGGSWHGLGGKPDWMNAGRSGSGGGGSGGDGGGLSGGSPGRSAGSGGGGSGSSPLGHPQAAGMGLGGAADYTWGGADTGSGDGEGAGAGSRTFIITGGSSGGDEKQGGTQGEATVTSEGGTVTTAGGPTIKIPPKSPNPMNDGSLGDSTGIALLDAAQFRLADFGARFVPGARGPIQALYPDGGVGGGDYDYSSGAYIDVREATDPVGPVAYRERVGGVGGVSGSFNRPGVYALYPEAPGADDDEAVAIVEAWNARFGGSPTITGPTAPVADGARPPTSTNLATAPSVAVDRIASSFAQTTRMRRMR
jgi:hypothetical protein